MVKIPGVRRLSDSIFVWCSVMRKFEASGFKLEFADYPVPGANVRN